VILKKMTTAVEIFAVITKTRVNSVRAEEYLV
jgi:hypothetical protein